MPRNPYFVQRDIKRAWVAAVISATVALAISGCQKKTAATNPDSQSKSELRDSTKPLQAADLVGYNGTKLRSSVDRIKEASAKRSREMEKMAEGVPDQ